jgi:hypothetical protein
VSTRIPLKMALLMGKVSSEDADALLAEHDAEVRRQDATRLLDERRHHANRAIFCDGIKHAAGLLTQWADTTVEKDTSDGRQPPAGESTPDFFQPGHTYAGSGGWRFRCDTVTTHPEDGELTALGWRYFNGRWEPIAYHQDDWETHQADGHTDIAEGSQ